MHKQSSESGVIRLPKIAPHLRLDFIPVDPAGHGKILLVTSQYDRNFCKTYPASDFAETLLSAVDGRTTATQLIQRTTASARHQHSEVAALLTIFAGADILISGEYAMADGLAALWLSSGFTPALVEQTLSRTRVAIINQAQPPECEQALRSMLHDLGLRAAGEDDHAALTAVVVDDYLQESLQRINRDYLQTQRAWLPVQLSGLVHWAGPVFNQSEADAMERPYLATDFCWQCLAERIEHSRQIEQAARRQAGIMPAPAPAMHPAALRASAYHIALEIAKHLLHAAVEARPAGSRFLSSAWVSDQVADQAGWHRVNKNPSCAICGEGSSSEPAAIELDSAETGARYVSSGWRIRPPEQTYADYRHLNNAYTGVVDSIDDLRNPTDDGCFTSESGSNIAAKSDSILMAMMSTQMRNAGKGTTPSAARTGALCEAIERYCTCLHGDEIRRRARYRDFPAGQALLPNDFMNFSDAQFAHRDRYNQDAIGNAFVNIPARLSEDEPCEWSPIWSVAQQRTVWTPTQTLYYGYPYRNQWIAVPDTNGVAAGNTKTEAFVQAFLEVLERDAISIWWYNKLRCGGVALDSVDIPFVQQAVKRIEQCGRRGWALDLSLDLGVPIFAFLSCAADSASGGICMGFSAHFDSEIALTRAICEHSQMWAMIEGVRDGANPNKQLSPDLQKWMDSASIEDAALAYLSPAGMRQWSEYPQCPEFDLQQQRQACMDMVEQKGWDLHLADFTRPSVGLPVIRVMIPALRNMHRRLGPGRLYDIPVEIGQRESANSEAEMNSIDMFI